MTWWRVEISTSPGALDSDPWTFTTKVLSDDPRVVSAALFAVVGGLDDTAERAQPGPDTVAVTADSAMNGLVRGLRKEVEELKVIRDQLAEDRDVLKIRLAEAHRAAVVRTGGKAPSAPLSRPVSAETPSRAPEAVQGPTGPQNRSEGDAGAVLRVVEAARAWREEGDHGRYARNQELREAVDALGDTPASVVPGTNWMTMARGMGWRSGVRWAAAEADARVASHGSAWAGTRGIVLGITDHLRLCAADPDRPTVVGRDEAPKERP